jgi:hypothetical protein
MDANCRQGRDPIDSNIRYRLILMQELAIDSTACPDEKLAFVFGLKGSVPTENGEILARGSKALNAGIAGDLEFN